jgi:TolA-binding protein
MIRSEKRLLLALLVVGLHALQTAPASMAQVRRYEPGRPTVSPYLNLFRNDGFDNRALPNYHSLVRPLQQQHDTNQMQQRLLQQQRQTLRQLDSNIQDIERRATTGQLVAPTGQGSWFGRPSRRSGYLNTSRFYSQSGTGAAGAGTAATGRR